MNRYRLPLVLLLSAAWMAAPAASLAAEASAAPQGTPVAWLRLENEAKQAYKGMTYRYLGDGDLQIVIDVRPQPGQAIDLLWGAKGDTREAVLTINGREVKLRHGGYDGFQWLRTAVPDGVTGERYEVALKAPDGDAKPAFVGEVRLIATGQGGPVAGADLKAAASKITVTVPPLAAGKAAAKPAADKSARAKEPPVEAFPEMRKLWDREPPAAAPGSDAAQEALYRQAEANARRAAEALYRCRRFVDGWLAHADPKSGLIPRNLGVSRDFWNARDSAADNYPFMVLTCAITDRAMFDGRMLDMLKAETRLTSRIDRLPDDFHFSKQGFATEKPNLDAVVFGAAEYVKDGLIPLTEWLGPSPWSERMIGLLDDIWKHAPIDTPFGKIPTLNFEVNGDLLQACSRTYWFTGDRKYLDWAIRLGDYYLLGDHHPTRDMKELALSDHSCEVINGLSELYAAVSVAAPEKKKAYEKPIHELYDRILAIGCNEHGLMYSRVSTHTGNHGGGLTDNWGYNYDGIYTAFLIDGTCAYRDAVRKVLGNLKEHYTGQVWQGGSADGYADSIEGAINLFNREPIPSAGVWIDSEILTMWGKQKPDGVIEGWHGDGNFARTSIMYALWKTQGATVRPWRADVRLGAVRDGDAVCLILAADEPWSGRVLFDKPRHKVNMHLPLDYPRINQFPEWFTTDAARRYTVRDLAAGTEKTFSGADLQAGLPVDVKPGVALRLRVTAGK